MVRDVEKPRAPAAMASLTTCFMASMSAGVAGSLRAPRSPITYERTAPWAIWVPTSMVHFRSVEGVEVLGEGLPPPFDAFGQRRARDVLDPLHQPDQPVVSVGPGRGEPDAAVAGDDGGDPVPAARGQHLVPGGLAVVVGVDVDPARGDQQPVGVDGPGRRLAGGGADAGDRAPVDGDVGGAGRCAGAVDDGSALGSRGHAWSFPLVELCAARPMLARPSDPDAMTAGSAADRSPRSGRGQRAGSSRSPGPWPRCRRSRPSTWPPRPRPDACPA